MSHVLAAPKQGGDTTLSAKERKRTTPFLYRRYGRRQWAVYCGEELICVVMYRKGARAVIEWLTRRKKPAHRSEKGGVS
jgi:hypothetical protein